MDPDGVARFEIRDIKSHLLFFNRLYNVHISSEFSSALLRTWNVGVLDYWKLFL
jgi:hypothetical protein